MSNRRFELAKSLQHFHKRLADVVDPGDKSIDLVKFAVDDKVRGLTYQIAFCVET
jgi:hypothetical protein